MKAFLMYKDKDFEPAMKLSTCEEALIQDLELATLFNTMAGDDGFLQTVAKSGAFSGLSMDVKAIRYRQDILKDCLANPFVVTGLYDLSIRAGETPRKVVWGVFGLYPESILRRSIDILNALIPILKELRNIATVQADHFHSEGFETLFSMVRAELSEEYFGTVEKHLKELKSRDEVLVSAQLGTGNKGVNYVLRKPEDRRWSWLKRSLPRTTWGRIRQLLPQSGPTYSYTLHPRDEAGAAALSKLRERGIHLVANSLAQSSDHILDFFKVLQTELAFYIGCLNLHERLRKKGCSVCFPAPSGCAERRYSVEGLYDVCLALIQESTVVGNSLHADDKCLVLITGANQGGKSTFLRSVGLSQLMMQCGMFVPAESMSANVCQGVFSHYTREEDVTMEKGKLEEELSRMSEIVDRISPNSMLLFNESFTATNEREGSEIARQIVSALHEKRIKMFFVTHLYSFAHGFFEKNRNDCVFLRAERQSDGTRTFKLVEGEPLETSFGQDLYRAVFEISKDTQSADRPALFSVNAEHTPTT